MHFSEYALAQTTHLLNNRFLAVWITGDDSGAGRSPNAMFFPAKQRICPSAHPFFVWRQSLRAGVRADGKDPYGKSEPLQGTRCGPDRRRVPAAQRGRRQKAPTRRGRRGHARRGRRGLPAGPGVPGVRRRGRLEERIDRGRGFKVALPLLRQEVHLPHRHRPRTLQKAAPRLDLLHQAHAPQRSR